ncbi:hypothetical protein [Parvibaculum sp.]|uniref:hypothetical protein n=1 Tax=Parvibaculum sp. TaxID=2024848 RepID=UPI001B2C8E01|nr:hypothetical protein [Parvibaculum sp.]MBO6668912.1 hypothetical protein [Parvibaculum sp.]MBO6691779.1 hypothetical protein [Parvibaculum sp.]MBO6715538.1 hypothetical protein [Parvibaculum sp.]
MLTKADDFPIHQTPEPIAFSGTDRNFYDRYFFNGYTRSGDVFFAAALGVYPHLNIMDGAFSVIVDGVQHNLHVSRFLNSERLDTQVGPLSIDVVEPLHSLRVRVAENEHGIKADLTFTGRAPALKEPRFTRRNGPRTLMDLTRLTQNGTWEGWIEVKGKRIEVKSSDFVGTRDRSWGVRPIGASDAQPMVPPMEFQFFWLWAPLNFDDCITLFHVNDDEHGEPWNLSGVVCPLGRDAKSQEMDRVSYEIDYISGSRHAKSCSIFFETRKGEKTRIDLTPKFHFYMMGIGYGHPEWAHGAHKGDNAVGYEEFRLSDIKSYAPPHLHIQAISDAVMTLPDGSTRKGCGILEQMIVGPHAPSGFTDILDPAK